LQRGMPGGAVAPRGMCFCFSRSGTIATLASLQPLQEKVVCGSPCSVLTHHAPENMCYYFVIGP
jgi:hypothetical protein